eukprot:GILJ01006908.1.p1 GENE.GILJ01006908.1~~GILJ01006908.1.p1  ORF type:complete len:441 (+),score=74.46 GILJ01006908.1:44-1366(+)
MVDKTSAEIFKAEGNAFFRDKHYESAIEKYDQCLTALGHTAGSCAPVEEAVAPPSDVCQLVATVLANKAACLLSLKRYDECIETCTDAISNDRNNTKALFRRAMALLEVSASQRDTEPLEKAVSDLFAALKLCPGDSTIRTELEKAHKLMAKRKPLTSISKKQDIRKAIPEASDFPSCLRDFAYRASPDCIDENLVIFFHGLGDSHQPFDKLAGSMRLSQTACLSLSGPLLMPLDLGRCWFRTLNDQLEHIVPSSSDRSRIDSLRDTRAHLSQVLLVLHEKYGWAFRKIFLFGFSQGATVALDLALHGVPEPHYLGGVVSISGGLLEEILFEMVGAEPIGKGVNRTSFVLTYGSMDDLLVRAVPEKTVAYLRTNLADVDVTFKTFPKRHEMINSEAEMREVMSFFASKLFMRNLSKQAPETGSDLAEVESIRDGVITLKT